MFKKLFNKKNKQEISKLNSTQIIKPKKKINNTENKLKKKWFNKLTTSLSKSNNNLINGISNIFIKQKINKNILEELEDTLIQADLGIDTAIKISKKLNKLNYTKKNKIKEISKVLNQIITNILIPVAKPLIINNNNKPHIILITGVNGSGKTTTIGKMAAKFKKNGKKVMLVAGDTFRAAAVEQLTIWSKQINIPIIHGLKGNDAASLIFDSINKAKKQNIDILIIDTAGRLENKIELMDELKKIVRTIKKQDNNAPHSSLLVLDATTGQNSINQADIFLKKINISGLIMTKLDGTARGGILVAITNKFNLPIHYIGIGENINDLESFNAESFAKALTKNNL